MEFETVFDLGQVGYKNWWYPAAGLFPLIAGALMAFAPRLTLKLMGPHVRGLMVRVLGLIFFIFSSVWCVLAFTGTYNEYRDLRRALAAGKYRTVEGVVGHFSPMPLNRSGFERFEVAGVAFQYSSGALTPGFNRTRAEGGPIAEGVYVRIAYIELDILRIEIRK